MWEKPIYRMMARSGKYVDIDVTSSCAPGLDPNKSIYVVADFFKRKGVDTILDFGAGALRHTIPLLERGFKVYAVEFEELYKRPACQKAYKIADKSPNFTRLIFPKQFKSFRHKFDAVLLCFVLPTMPLRKERNKLLDLVEDKLKGKSFIYWMSQYGKYEYLKKPGQAIGDGWYLQPNRKFHSFYCEFKNAEIDLMMERIGFTRIRVLGESGHDQFRLYTRGVPSIPKGTAWP